MKTLWQSKNNLITFTAIKKVAEEYEPKPATRHIPQWYKNTSNRIGNKNPDSLPTVKKCIPFFDAITAGYILVTTQDVYVKQVEGEPVFQLPASTEDMIQFHPVAQASKHPAANGFQFPKWMNPWGIRTPKGYSVLFTAPMNTPNPWFEIFSGVVDTDTYTAAVNFPFILKDAKFEGLIPAGTPMAQIIPFKRESWKMIKGNEEDTTNQLKVMLYLQSQFFDRYKRLFWSRKEYK